MVQHLHSTFKPECYRCDLSLDEPGVYAVTISRDDLLAMLGVHNPPVALPSAIDDGGLKAGQHRE